MMFYSNPMFSNVETTSSYSSENTATYQGITLKTLLLLGIAGLTGIIAGFVLYKFNDIRIYLGALLISLVVGVISLIVGRSNPRKSMACGIMYSIAEGSVLGMITLICDLYYEGIAIMAVGTTAVIFSVCLALFACGALRNVSKLRGYLILTICSIIAVSLMVLILSLFDIMGSGTLIKDYTGIVLFIEVLYLLYGCFMLFLNFNEATSYVQMSATKDFEWTAAFGLMVSILYIYLEVLRLLVYIMGSSRNN